MHGTNPIRPPLTGDGSTLDVQNIFSTLQGEGPHAGCPAVFIRLGGCNLACDFCDTEFETFKAQGVETILHEVEHMAAQLGARLVVLTGGEPLRQPIEKLCEALLAKGFMVQVETNGTLWRNLPEDVQIVCSPKNTGQGYFPIRPDLLERVSAFKFIISKNHPLYGKVGDVGQSGAPVYLQPMDEGDEARNRLNVEYAVRLAKEHGCRLSIQAHKLLGLQ